MWSLHIAQKKRGGNTGKIPGKQIQVTPDDFDSLIGSEDNLKCNSFMLGFRIGKKGGGDRGEFSGNKFKLPLTTF